MTSADWRQERRERRAQQIFAIAMELFRTKGYESTTVEEITAAAGVAKGTFFNYFPTKEALLGHLGDLQVARLHTAIAETSHFGELDTRDQLHFVFHTLAAGVEQQRELTRLIVALTLTQTGAFAKHQRLVRENLEAVLLAIVRRGQERGDLRSDVAPEALAGLVRNFYFLTLLGWLAQEATHFVAMLDEQLDLVLEGLLPKT
jgi:AcrR family transcriptional regulator